MKVLSIDIDYAFPTVDEWPNDDNELWDEWHPWTKWDFYFKKYPDLNNRETIIDEQCLDYLLDTYTKALTANPNAHVWFGLDHDYILDYLHDKNDIDLINIDHHDDFLAGCYVDRLDTDSNEEYLASHLLEYSMAKAYGKVDEGSWGAYLHSQGRLNSMTWIKNDDGKEMCDTRHPTNKFICENVGKYCEWNTVLAKDFNHGNYQYDAIFVCLSPTYFPPSQWNLFSIFMAIYEDYTGKSCKLDEFWDRRWINRMAYRKPYEVLSESLAQVKKSLDK
jgi:hypothetical protein